VKRRVVARVDLAAKLGCLFLPKLRYLWRFACGHEELRSHKTLSGNGARNGRYYGICKQCSCPKA
jgi:hypothetical protein